jgi:hypothetical protein
VARRNTRTRNKADAAVEAAPPMAGADRFGPANRRRLSGPGLRAFLNIADLWGLSEGERMMVLGLPGRSTYFGWVSRARDGKDLTLPVDVLLRISGVLGVHKALRILFGGSKAEEVSWLRDPHDAPVFGGQPPMALLANGTQDGIMLVRRYLDAFRGGVFAPLGTVDLDFQPYSDDDVIIV